MTNLELLLIGVGLSMDAFAVAVCKGLGMRRINYRHMLIIALFFGGFQALMPFLGWLLGSRFAQYITRYDHWIAFLLLLFIGGGCFLSRKFGWPDWAMIICIVLGIVFMIGGAVSYLYKLIKMYEKTDKPAPKAFTSSRRENDYYDDYSKR